ncbi:Cupin domain-containing protein [Lentzea fradiae]|uniref:Cupin domain-containing protein n=1 Tax=Lentzea fradiae TaxID=200378 RepID=A0A1G7VIK9_9PSEU|nr:cupin domain-containing protein [Lentzea fradiae]SDG59584.1 Cupin domain-containing protein [Lentzea fradiae]
MTTSFETALRTDVRFDPEVHIRGIQDEPFVQLVDHHGRPLEGIKGVAGVAEEIGLGVPIGADRLVMQPGTAFELHTHPGAHILYVLSSRGFIHIDGVDYEMKAGDTVFVPADYAHGVKTNAKVSEPLQILAFGVPHMPLESKERMTLVEG